MTSPTVEKIKPILDFSLVSKFDTNEMQENSYIPICISKGSVYVFAKAVTQQSFVLSKVSAIMGMSNINLKTISDNDFDELLDFVKRSLHVESDQDLEKSSSDEDIQLKYDDGEINYGVSID